MKKRLILATVLLIGSVLVLSGCSTSSKTKPTSTTTQTKSSVTPKPTGLDSGLMLPSMKSFITTISSGPAVDKYGVQYVNDAFKSAFAFIYRSQNISELWEPNTKKNPAYIGYAKSALTPIGNYFIPEINKGFQSIIPDLLNPTINKAKDYNKNASLWTKLILLPSRNPDGTLPNAKSGDINNYVLMYPWVFQTSVGLPIATVSTLDGYGGVLNLQFSYLIQQPYGDGKNVSVIVTTTKDMTFQMVRNTDQSTAKDYPWLIGSWGFINNGTVTANVYDSKTMGAIPKNPNEIRFP